MCELKIYLNCLQVVIIFLSACLLLGWILKFIIFQNHDNFKVSICVMFMSVKMMSCPCGTEYSEKLPEHSERHVT